MAGEGHNKNSIDDKEKYNTVQYMNKGSKRFRTGCVRK